MEKLINKHISIIFILLLTIILCNCNGVRYGLPKRFSGRNEVLLYKNGKFYMIEGSHMLSNTEYYGEWVKKKDTVFLNITRTRSLDSYYLNKYTVKELNKGSKDSIYFEIKVTDCSTNAGVLILNDLEVLVNDNGFAQISKQKVNQLLFNPKICFAEVNYDVIDTTANYFLIELKNSFEPAFTAPTTYIKKFMKLIPFSYDSAGNVITLRHPRLRKFL